MRPLLTVLLRRLVQLVGVVLATAVLNFALLKALPGDLVDVIASLGAAALPLLQFGWAAVDEAA